MATTTLFSRQTHQPAHTLYRNPHKDKRIRNISHLLALILSISTLLLLAAGALVTGTGSSLAVPDWPLAYGEWFPPMVGGILYEHGHRIVATLVGMMTIIMALRLWIVEERSWVKLLGYSAIGLVIFQGVMGGITVIFLIPKAVSISHALLAQLFFVLTVIILQVTAPGWDGMVERGRRLRNAGTGRLHLWGIVTMALLWIELLIGATVRHNSAGLAIPDFPLAYGGLIPPLTSFPLIIHFLHRVVALLVLIFTLLAVWEVLRRHRDEGALTRAAAAAGILVVLQIILGGTSIWTQLSVPVTTLHLVNGALLLVAVTLLYMRSRILAPTPGSRNLFGGHPGRRFG